jgi:hypothetical protein
VPTLVLVGPEDILSGVAVPAAARGGQGLVPRPGGHACVWSTAPFNEAVLTFVRAERETDGREADVRSDRKLGAGQLGLFGVLIPGLAQILAFQPVLHHRRDGRPGRVSAPLIFLISMVAWSPRPRWPSSPVY